MKYHLVRCRIVEDLIDSPHLSQDCTKSQQVTQHIHPGVQLHGKSHVQWWEYHSSMTAKYCSYIILYYLPTVVKIYQINTFKFIKKTLFSSHNAANMVCCLVSWVQQLNINGEIHQQRASNNNVVELWTWHAHNTAKGNDHITYLLKSPTSHAPTTICFAVGFVAILFKDGVYSCADVSKLQWLATWCKVWAENYIVNQLGYHLLFLNTKLNRRQTTLKMIPTAARM